MIIRLDFGCKCVRATVRKQVLPIRVKDKGLRLKVFGSRLEIGVKFLRLDTEDGGSADAVCVFGKRVNERKRFRRPAMRCDVLIAAHSIFRTIQFL